MSQPGPTATRYLVLAIVLLVIGLAAGYTIATVSAPTRTVTATATVTQATTVPVTRTVERTVTATVTSVVERTATATLYRTVTSPVTVTATATVTRAQTVTVYRTVTATAAPGTLNLAQLAEAIRAGAIDVGSEYGMKLGQRYHNIHVNVLGLGCTTCHKSADYVAYPADYLYINIPRVLDAMTMKGMPGPVDRSVCLACHKVGGIATPFYEPMYGKGDQSAAAG